MTAEAVKQLARGDGDGEKSLVAPETEAAPVEDGALPIGPDGHDSIDELLRVFRRLRSAKEGR